MLLEAQTVGWAASGRNGGFCEASITHGEENGRSRWPEEYATLEAMGRANLDAFEADVRDLGLACEWERTGQLSVAVEEHQLAWLADAPEVLDATQTRARIDSPLFLGGALARETTALVHPARLALELARVAADLGVELHEHSAVTGLRREGQVVEVATDRATVRSGQVVLATSVFPPLLRRNRLMTVPVYDYVLMTEPLSREQLAAIGWSGREGLGDLANQFHYSRLTADHRILWGGYDAIYPPGGQVHVRHEDRPDSHARLASHLLATFPQLEGIRITHRWAGAIDTSTQFAAFYGLTPRRPGGPRGRLHGLGVARPGGPRRCCSTCSAARRRAAPSCAWSTTARCRSRPSRWPRSGSTSPLVTRPGRPPRGTAQRLPARPRPGRPGLRLLSRPGQARLRPWPQLRRVREPGAQVGQDPGDDARHLGLGDPDGGRDLALGELVVEPHPHHAAVALRQLAHQRAEHHAGLHLLVGAVRPAQQGRPSASTCRRSGRRARQG